MSTYTEERPATDNRPPSTVRYALILGGLTAFGPLSIDMYLPALPTMSGDLRASSSTLQLTLTAFFIGLALGQLVIGPLSDAFGRRRPLLIGITIYATASVLCALSPSAELLIAARGLQAIGASAGMVVARATVRDLFGGTAMTRFFSMLILVTGLAPILAPVVGGQVLNWTSWRGVFLVLTGFGVLLLIVAALALPEPLPPWRRTPARLGAAARTYLALLRDRAFLGYALASGLVLAGLFAYIAGSSFVLQDVYGLSPQQYSLVFGANGIGIVLLGQVNGRIVGRFPERVLLRTGLLVGAASALAMVLGLSLGLGLIALLPPLFLIISSIGLTMPNITSLALTDHPRTAGAASALLGVLQFVLGGVASPLVGLGGTSSALPMALIMASFGLLALLVYSLMTRRGAAQPLPATA
ncbi:Bcr/CflA family multidrug efflux MFS transporter [Amycolatopsis cihanbeyliensis]|uniref:DHA1 family bicyclomycin/chloramphenicol resistance-like MFS transporter n=1 Tax=Amycolatopsis cihanbeyliensis TaxID=1128664 RepID=A0A542CU85_AMYCI|nr:Bcr/CflA family multidrug efflux MFS transporter [Amycolatopsis cihanbeyliensis]TQI94350.1 DHA1 family bicyclomycin/chloramphenicol resistance-like MFS transporter [Amycolatopsis cihanbeyliensis]